MKLVFYVGNIMVIIGMDPPVSKNCGWAVVELEDGKLKLLAKFTQVLDSYPAGLEAVYGQTEKLLAAYGPKVLCMERQMGGGLFFARAKLNEFVGVTKLCCLRHGVDVAEISPAHLKMIIAGHGQAPKKKIMSNVVKMFGLSDAGEEHECDAAAFAVCHMVDNGWTGYSVADPYTDEERQVEKDRKAKKKANKVKRFADKKTKG